MTDGQPRNIRELDTRLHNGRLLIERLISQAQLGKVDPKLLAQRLASIQETLDLALEDRKPAVENEKLARLYKVTRLIGKSLDLQVVLEQVMDAIIMLTSAERGFVMLLEEGELKLRFARNFELETLTSGTGVSHSILKRVVETGQPILTTNAQEDPRFSAQNSVVIHGLSSIMATPLRAHDQIIAAIYVDNRAQAGVFSEDDLRLLDMFGEQAAIAIDNAVQVLEREKMLKAQIESLRIEVDEARKARQVAEIVETDYFQQLQDKVKLLRSQKTAHENKPDKDSGEQA